MTHPGFQSLLPRGDYCLTVASYSSPLLGGVAKGRGGYRVLVGVPEGGMSPILPGETLHLAVSS